MAPCRHGGWEVAGVWVIPHLSKLALPIVARRAAGRRGPLPPTTLPFWLPCWEGWPGPYVGTGGTVKAA